MRPIALVLLGLLAVGQAAKIKRDVNELVGYQYQNQELDLKKLDGAPSAGVPQELYGPPVRSESAFVNAPQFVDDNSQQQELFSGFEREQSPSAPEYQPDSSSLTISCTGSNRVCVHRANCQNGFVVDSQSSSHLGECKVGEVCCSLSQRDSSLGHQDATLTQNEDEYQTSGIKHYSQESTNNGYLPPYGGEPSNSIPSYQVPNDPAEEGSSSDADPVRQGNEIDPVHIQVGCAAALLCVEEELCTMEGMISTERVRFTEEQLLRRVPLSVCKNPETGIIGKCCRDPNYVDPWPQGPLPKNYTGGFDEKGFPTFLNLDKVAPPTKTKVNPNRGPGAFVKRPNPFLPPQPVFQSQAIDSVNAIPGFESRPVIKVTVPPRQEEIEVHPQHFPSSTFAPVEHVPVQPFPSTLAPVKGAPSLAVSTYEPVSSTYQPVASSTYRPVVSSTYKPIQSTYHAPEVVSSTYQPVVSSTYRPVSSTFEPVSSTHRPVPTYTTPAPTYQSSSFRPSVNNPFLTLSSTPAPVEQSVEAIPDQEIIAIQPQAPVRYSPEPVTAAPTPAPVTFDKQYEVSPSHSIAILSQRQPGQKCGLRNQVPRPNGLIDVDAAYGEIPWTAMVVSNAERKPFCSGAIVSQNAVITSASCLEGRQVSDISVKVGEWKLGYELKHEEPLPFELIQVVSVINHPGYASGLRSHDVAVLLLERPAQLDRHVDVLCLGENFDLKPNSRCIATGWGKVVLQANVVGAVMHRVDVDLIPRDECRRRVLGTDYPIEVDDTVVCTKAQKESNNMCQVDQGGPLACDQGDGIYTLMGVYSQDTGCVPTNQVATFALIDSEWVKQVISQPPAQFEAILPNRFVAPVVSSTPAPVSYQPSYTPEQYVPPVVVASTPAPVSHQPSYNREQFVAPVTASTPAQIYYQPSFAPNRFVAPVVASTVAPISYEPYYAPQRPVIFETPGAIQQSVALPLRHRPQHPKPTPPQQGYPQQPQPGYPQQPGYPAQQQQPGYPQQPQRPCDCQNSYLPPELNQYLPPAKL